MVPEAVPPPTALAGASIAETHISVLFFLGDRAYKLKKPVHFPFADFTTREAREIDCHREVELNRRLAPDVYLGVADILGSDGAPCDHLVVMRRMPDDRRLSHLVRSGDPAVVDRVEQIARQLASFHESAQRSPTIDRAALPGAISARWEANFAELQPFIGVVIGRDSMARARHLANRFIAGRRALFLERIAGKYICDGHGDVQADDVFCLDDGPRILDCVEFCDEFRFGDVADDIAFLAMDLERLGVPDLSRRFVAGYERAAGEPFPAGLLDFAIAYRAQVRAKVACLRTVQLEAGSPQHQVSADAARTLLDLCVQHLEAARVQLVIVGGLPGTGKTTVARGLANELRAAVLRSDVIRKERACLDPAEPASAAFKSALYTTDVTVVTYRDMIDRASRILDTGRSVVLDASFANAQHRRDARNVAIDTSSDLTELHCVLNSAEAASRLRWRREHEHDASDATPAIAAAIATTFADWPEATEIPTAGSPSEALALAMPAMSPGFAGDK